MRYFKLKTHRMRLAVALRPDLLGELTALLQRRRNLAGNGDARPRNVETVKVSFRPRIIYKPSH